MYYYVIRTIATTTYYTNTTTSSSSCQWRCAPEASVRSAAVLVAINMQRSRGLRYNLSLWLMWEKVGQQPVILDAIICQVYEQVYTTALVVKQFSTLLGK